MRFLAFVFALLALAACAPVVQRPLTPAASFPGPRLEGEKFVSFDGAALGFSHWDPPDGREFGMAYRRAWLLIDELNRSLKSPATHSEQGGQSGGGCTLTPVGETIIRLYRDVEVEAQRSCAKQIAELTRLIRS